MTELVESWKSFVEEEEGYCDSATYSLLLPILTGKENEEEKDLNLKGNQPSLSKNRLVDFDMKILCKAFELHPGHVHTLNLSYNSLSDKSMIFFHDYLKDPACSLCSLDLSYNDLEAEGIGILSDALQFNKSVAKLELNGCKMGHKGGLQIASMLQVNVTIKRLGLGRTDLSTDCIIAMATVLQGNKALQSVDLSRPLLHSLLEETTVHLSKMLQVNDTLQELYLTHHNMTDTGLERICEVLHKNTSITILDVSSNKFSRDGAHHFAKLLRQNPPLQQLDISHNRIQDEGLVWMSEALESENTNLKKLNVEHNSIGDTGLCALAKALQTNTSLQHVTIWGNIIFEPTCKAFRWLLESGRLLPENTDVKPYEVDGVNYLARTG